MLSLTIKNKSRGGSRPGAGRKRASNPKQRAQLYFTADFIDKIDTIDIAGCNNLSQKCELLIEMGIEAMETSLIAEKDTSVNDGLSINTDVVKYIDLFAGMGGLRLGFEQALESIGLKGKSVFVSEIKKSAIEAYSNYFPEEKIYGDITKIHVDDIPDFDYVLAGFPCQAFSSAGNRLGFEDTRGTLFFDVARIIKGKRPKGFLLENVEGLVTHDNGRTFSTILNTLKDIGYKVSYKVLDSKYFGIAQSRKRIYIVGTLSKSPNMEDFPIHETKLNSIIEKSVDPINTEFTEKLLEHYSIDEVIGKQIKDKRGGKNNIHSWDFELKGEISDDQKNLLDSLLRQRRNKKWASIIGIDWMDGMPLTEKMIQTFFPHPELHSLLEDLVSKGYLAFEYPKKKVGNKRVYDERLEKGYNIITGKLSFEFSKILDPNDVTPTLVATDVVKLAVPIKNGLRQLTIREGLRLFGFPDDYSLEYISQPKAYDLLGNTVCVPVVKAVAERLLNASL